MLVTSRRTSAGLLLDWVEFLSRGDFLLVGGLAAGRGDGGLPDALDGPAMADREHDQEDERADDGTAPEAFPEGRPLMVVGQRVTVPRTDDRLARLVGDIAVLADSVVRVDPDEDADGKTDDGAGDGRTLVRAVVVGEGLDGLGDASEMLAVLAQEALVPINHGLHLVDPAAVLGHGVDDRVELLADGANLSHERGCERTVVKFVIVCEAEDLTDLFRVEADDSRREVDRRPFVQELFEPLEAGSELLDDGVVVFRETLTERGDDALELVVAPVDKFEPAVVAAETLLHGRDVRCVALLETTDASVRVVDPLVHAGERETSRGLTDGTGCLCCHGGAFL